MRLFAWSAALVTVLAAVLVVNTWRQPSRQLPVDPLPPIDVNEQAAAESLAVAIQARTVAGDGDAMLNADQFASLHAHLETRYPRVHTALQREAVGGLSLLYTWTGREANAPAIALLAHQDVVPIAPETEDLWQVDPFAGVIDDGFVWGRGAWDNKGNLIAQLEAVERLLASGFVPARTVYLVFGADEELGGHRGARVIADRLARRGVRLDFVLDEGLLITDGILPGLSQPAAIVGMAEKGSVSVRLRATAAPGHSSMPPPPGQAAIARLARAVTEVDTHPMPASLDRSSLAGQMLSTLAPEMSILPRIVLSNLWLFGPVVRAQLAQSPTTNALLRTTAATTVIRGGVRENVLPGEAEAIINFRIKPGDTSADVIEHVRRVVSDSDIEVALHGVASEPSHVASVDGRGYQLVSRSVREVAPAALVAPGLLVAASDSVHFQALSGQVLKFSPIRAGSDDLARLHGTNERLSVANLAEMIRFYHRLIAQAAGN